MFILSVFPGIDLLGRAFEESGFCVVRGPDLIWGGDIRTFNPPRRKFDGVIGGSPCQDFSKARRDPPTGYGLQMLDEFCRVVSMADPRWFILENVPAVPDVKIAGYTVQRFDLRASEYGLNHRRLRHIQYGSRVGKMLVMPRTNKSATEPTITTRGQTAWGKVCEAMGLPAGFDIPAFTKSAKRRAVGNGVPLPMGRAIAHAVKNAVPIGSAAVCVCGCGRPVAGTVTRATAACRKRIQRRREKGHDQ